MALTFAAPRAWEHDARQHAAACAASVRGSARAIEDNRQRRGVERGLARAIDAALELVAASERGQASRTTVARAAQDVEDWAAVAVARDPVALLWAAVGIAIATRIRRGQPPADRAIAYAAAAVARGSVPDGWETWGAVRALRASLRRQQAVVA